jgi:lipoprotein-anchoring transpeptidase ErfK/SrfK
MPRRPFFFLLVAGAIACGPARPAPVQVQVPVVAEQAVPTPRPSPYLVLRLAERRLYLMMDDVHAPPEAFPIAVGRAGRETPTGQFQIEYKELYPEYVTLDPNDRSRILRRVPPGPDNPLGERWMQITHGEGWSVGIHGTPRPELLGQAVSGGCIRMRNADVIRIYDRVEVGTKVLVYE